MMTHCREEQVYRVYIIIRVHLHELALVSQPRASKHLKHAASLYPLAVTDTDWMRERWRAVEGRLNGAGRTCQCVSVEIITK